MAFDYISPRTSQYVPESIRLPRGYVDSGISNPVFGMNTQGTPDPQPDYVPYTTPSGIPNTALYGMGMPNNSPVPSLNDPSLDINTALQAGTSALNLGAAVAPALTKTAAGSILGPLGLGIGAVNMGIEGFKTYQAWRDSKKQAKRQAEMDRQNRIQNRMNTEEYLAGDPVGRASRASVRDRMNYIDYLAGRK
jgi:hypothetical protein